MWLVFRYALAAVRAVARERRELALENIALRHQIEVLTRNRRRPQLQPADRLLWSSLSRMWPSWRRHIVIVQPDTVVRWHRTVWRRYWRWKSRGGRRGRPRIEPELAELIRRMTQENPRWGHMRVLGELRKLGFRVSLLTVRRYRKDVPRDPLSSWRTFLENHRPEIWASDFFTVHTLWFHTLYVFFFVAHDRRTVMHVNVTAHPTATWVWRQLINATPWGNSPRFLIRDRDRSYGRRLHRAGEAHRHPHGAHADRHAAGQRHRGAAGGHISAGVPGPHHHRERTAPAVRAPRVRPAL